MWFSSNYPWGVYIVITIILYSSFFERISFQKAKKKIRGHSVLYYVHIIIIIILYILYTNASKMDHCVKIYKLILFDILNRLFDFKSIL